MIASWFLRTLRSFHTQVKEINKVRVHWCKYVGLAQTTLALIMNDAAWGWMAKIDEYPAMKGHIEGMHQFLQLHVFFQTVVVDELWKKQFEKKEISENYSNAFNQFEESASRCEHLVTMMQRMQKSRAETKNKV